jgi:hypothetical protein
MTPAWGHFLLQLLILFGVLAGIAGIGIWFTIANDNTEGKRPEKYRKPKRQSDHSIWYEYRLARKYECRLNRLIRRSQRQIRRNQKRNNLRTRHGANQEKCP